jgi:hypothetical protein
MTCKRQERDGLPDGHVRFTKDGSRRLEKWTIGTIVAVVSALRNGPPIWPTSGTNKAVNRLAGYDLYLRRPRCSETAASCFPTRRSDRVGQPDAALIILEFLRSGGASPVRRQSTKWRASEFAADG